MPTPMSDETLAVLEQQISEAAQLRIALSRGEVSRVKQDVRTLLGENAMFRDLVPERWWRAEHTSTPALEDAITAAKARIAALPTVMMPALLALTNGYIERAERLIAAQDAGTKSEVKTDALDYLEHHADAEVKRLYPVGGLRELVGRRNHIASKKVLEALLKARSKIDLSLSSAHAEVEQHISHIDPFAGKSHLKAEIIFLFQTHFPRIRFPSTMGYTRYIRQSHAPIRDLLRALVAARSALEAVATPEARAALIKTFEHFAFLLRERKKMQARATACIARATEMQASLEASQEHVARMLAGVQKKRVETARALAALEADAERSGAQLLRVQARLEAGRDELARLGDGYDVLRADGASETTLVAARTEIDRAERLVRTIELEERSLIAEIEIFKTKATTLLITLDQLAQVELHCTEKAANIQASLVRAKAAFAKYEQVKTLVFYFGTRDNIFEKLLSIGRFLKGGRDDVDAMGNISVLLLFEAGVRVGVELGIVNLNAKVALTLMVGGTLSILDSREMMFAHRLALYATASTEASVSGGKKIGELLHAPIEVPDTLLEASARARCRLYDRETCYVYEDEEHWAFTWAHEIARRIAFLRGYTVTDPACHREGGDWVEQSLGELVGGGITPSDSRVSPQGGDAKDWKNMLKVEAGLLTHHLHDRPVRTVCFDQACSIEGSATVRVVGLGEHSFDRETPIGQATFSASVEITGTKSALGTLVEDSSIYVYAGESERRMGSTTFHKFKGAGLPEDDPGALYLEVTDKEANRVGTETFNLQWSSSSAKSLATPAHRGALARALRNAQTPSTYTKKVGLPALAAGDARSTLDDPASFAKGMRIRLDMLVGKHPIGMSDKVINRIFTAPETLKDAGTKLSSAATTLEKAPALIGSSPLPSSISAPVSSLVSDVRDRIAPLAQGASGVLSEVAERTSFLSELQVSLGASSSSYARYFGQPRFEIKSGRIEWKRSWTAQVYRGTNLKTFSLRLERDVEVAPLVAVFFKFELQFRKEYAEYEVIGVDTLSYMKTLHASFREKGDRSKRYWDLHGDELLQICQNVVDTDSGAFAEVVYDASKSSEGAKLAARQFGKACWATFLPHEASPFAGTAPIDAVAIGRAAATLEKLRLAQAGRTPEALAAHRDILTRLDTPEAFAAGWKSDIDAAVEITRKYGASFAKLGRPEGVSPDLTREIEPMQSARIAQKADATRRFSRGFASLDEESLKSSAADLANAFEASLAIDEQEHSVLWSRAFSTPTQLSSKLRECATSPFPIREILGELLKPMVDRLGETSKVPDAALWLSRSKENISYFQLRSTATKALDAVVNAFHTSLASFQRDVLTPLRTQRGDVQSGTEAEIQRYADRLLAAIKGRLQVIETLDQGLQTWKAGRDPEKSERTPNICMFLERPLRIERASLRLLERLLSIRLRIADQFVRRVLLQRLGNPPPPNMSLLRAALDKYLEATYTQFANHALVHGIKKLQLPGEDHKPETVEEDKPPKAKIAAPPTPSAVSP